MEKLVNIKGHSIKYVSSKMLALRETKKAEELFQTERDSRDTAVKCNMWSWTGYWTGGKKEGRDNKGYYWDN